MLHAQSNRIFQIWKNGDFFQVIFSYLTELFDAIEQIHHVLEYYRRIQEPLWRTKMGYIFLKMRIT